MTSKDISSSDSHAGGHGIAHVMPLSLMFGVFAALLVLTILTVSVTAIDFGPQVNLVVAMGIATVKAGLVVCYFMHLRWDRPFNALVFFGSLLFVSLFISLTLLDKSEYEADIQEMYLLKGE